MVIAGTVSGAAVGAALTVLGKIVADAPAATPANYLWNMVAFGLIAAIVSPIVTWSALRNVPLWRAILEPLAAGIAGAAFGVLLGSGIGLLVLTPLGIGSAIARLSYASRDKRLSRES